MDFPCYSGAHCFTFNPKKIGYTEKNRPTRETKLFRRETSEGLGRNCRWSEHVRRHRELGSMSSVTFRHPKQKVTLGVRIVVRSL